MRTNPIPSYHARPHVDIDGKTILGRFDIYETREDETQYIFSMWNSGDRFQEILKRGIPLDMAKTVFYEMDSK